MTITAIKRVNFEEASASADWRFPYQLIVPGVNGWDPLKDEVVLGMSPDAITWDDYGLRSRVFPTPAPDNWSAPFFFASSNDGTGTITLVNPNLIDIVVAWGRIRQMGPGVVNVGIQYRNSAGARTSLLSGRLPLVDTVV
jgi:hypothetical protein